MNIENLKPFDNYLISLDRLYSSYNQTISVYKQGKWEIDWCDKNAQYYIDCIQNCYYSLKKNYSNFKNIKNKIEKTYSTLTDYEKNIFNENKYIYKNAKELLNEVGLYLNNNNIFQI